MPIYFYSQREEPYGCFSNFSPHGFEAEGHYWPTSEHYFQAQKFVGTSHAGDVRLAHSPKHAAEIGRDRHRPLRSDWAAVKDDVMRYAVRRKFETHPAIRAVLLGTGDAELIEATSGDYYWGCGTNGTGQNRLGQILVEVRTWFRAQEQNA